MQSTPHPDPWPNGDPQGIQPAVAVLERLQMGQQWQHLLQMSQDRLSQCPHDVPGHQFSALALMMLRRPKEAEKHVEWLLQNDPEESYHYILAAQLSAQRDKLSAMKKFLNIGLSLHPDNPSLHRLMATCLAAKGRTHKALEHANLALELDGGSTASLQTREIVMQGTSYVNGRWKDRIHGLRQALHLDPSNSYTQWQIGQLLLEMERPKAAERWLAQSLAQEPNSILRSRDWKEAYERKFFLYRCLSYPWRMAKRFQLYLDATRHRPALFFLGILTIKVWSALGVYWLMALTFLAPFGWLARFFLFMHPAFDNRWLPRRWLRSQSLTARCSWMLVTAGLGISVLTLLTSSDFVYFLGLCTLAMLTLQAFVTGVFILVRRIMTPSLPQEWI